MVLPEQSAEEVRALVAGKSLESRQFGLQDGDVLLRILLQVEESEAVMDLLDEHDFGKKGRRILILPVAATLPRVDLEEDEKSSSTASEEQARERVGRQELYEDVKDSAKCTRVYLAMVVLSTIVAAAGLRQDSVAVIIGAMVIAPLLGPNMALALGTTLGDLSLLWGAFRTSVAGTVTVITCSFIIKILTDAGIIPGIKVDAGAKDLAGHPGEKVTEGLDGLRERLAEYAQMGARFAKWRAVIALGDGLPTRGCIEANAHALARYAALCQEAGLVPIVEPEVLMGGKHTLEHCSAATEKILRSVFNALYTQGVVLEAMLVKPNMVLPGLTCPKQETAEEVADATVECLLRAVPAAVPGIAFLSGGQPAELASARLNAMNVRFKGRLPWTLTFSFARAIQQPALEIWRNQEARTSLAQQALLHRARCNRAARRGQYNAAMEVTGA